MRDVRKALLKELVTASIWAAFGLGVLFATRPVWSQLLFAETGALTDQLAIRCLGL